MSLKLTFCGGVGQVTGANFLLESLEWKLLVDCGLLQGVKFAEDFNRTPFPYNPALIDYLCITHAHMDHIGKIPKLVRDGFRGTIYSTSITRELASVMLADALTLLENEAKREGVLPLYE